MPERRRSQPKSANAPPRKFTADQRNELLSLGVYPEQVHRLEAHALTSIASRLVRPPPMSEVRDKLTDFAAALERVERLYVRISTTAGASAEASSRLYLAQEALGFTRPDELDTLHNALETATNIVNRALGDLPKEQRTTRQNSAEYVRLILRALLLGHVDHFRCSGFGDTPEPDPFPPFLIKATRTKRARSRRNRATVPFGEVARIVSDANGGWSSDDAIRAYRKVDARKERSVNLRRRKRH